MIRDSSIDELTTVYNMFSRRDASFELLRNHIRDYIANEGSKLVEDEKLKNEDLVIRLIELRERINEIHVKSMQRDNAIDLTIKMAFEKVVNTSNRTAKALVYYLDEMFKKEFKTIAEDELIDRLDKVIQIFRYLLDKDVFEGFYVNSFARRLLE